MCVSANPRSLSQSNTEQGLTLRGAGPAKGREAPLLPREVLIVALSSILLFIFSLGLFTEFFDIKQPHLPSWSLFAGIH